MESWSKEELKDLLEYVHQLRKDNADLRAMIIASDAMIKNKEAQIKSLKELLWKAYN